jgi:GT2 family glycosyltransferase/intein/homing endonuclease
VSPLPAYLDYAKDGVNALVADTKEEWLSAILKLRDDLTFREQLAASGYDTALKRLNPRSQADKLFMALSHNGFLSPWPVDTFLQIIIPHYSPSVEYLSLAVESALGAKGPAREVLVLSSSQNDPRGALSVLSDRYKNLRILYTPNRLSFSEANNWGIREADKRATHFLLLNDDTILSSDCLFNMVSTVVKGGDRFLLNPYSNCDRGWLHNDALTVGLTGKELRPGMTLADFSAEELADLKNGFGGIGEGDELEPTSFCAFYCTLIPKGIVDRVGFLSTLFKNGGEDLDYCERAKRMGFESFWDRSAHCFHFGGKTRKVAEGQEFVKYHKEDQENNLLARRRWPKDKKRIGIWTGPAFERWDLDTYRIPGGGLGGSETCAGRLAETAAAAGHSVYMYGLHDRKEQNGVQLVPWNEFIPEEEYFDLFIASRNLNCIDDRLKAKNILVWVHDVWLLSGQHISDYHRQRVTKFACLSPWHVNFFSDYHKIDKSQIIIIPNGINVELFERPNIDEKVFGKMVYSSSPDRGLDNLLYLMPYIKDHVPDLHIDIYYGFFNWESAVKHRNNPWEVEKMEQLKELIEKSKDFATLKGRISQTELAKEWHKAYLWGYLTDFKETFCCLPNTQISMEDGSYKKICDVGVGDTVITHKGSGKVITTMQREINEEVYSIKIKNLKDTLQITGEHPLLVAKRKKSMCGRTSGYCNRNREVCKYYKYTDKKDRSHRHVVTKPCQRIAQQFEPEWMPANCVKKGDLLCIVLNKQSSKPPKFYEVVNGNKFDYRCDINYNHHAINIIDDFEIDEDFLEFCGWYMAEGYFSGDSILTFSLHINEISEAELIKRNLHRIGLSYREDIREHESTRIIVTHSVILGKFFSSFGRTSKDRCIPKWIKDLDPHYLKYFLRGLLQGDGCQIQNTCKLECASSNLVYDMFEIFLKFNCISYLANSQKKQPIIIRDKDTGVNKITHSDDKFFPAFLNGCSLTQNKELFEFMGYTVSSRGRTDLLLNDDTYAYLPITKIHKIPYSGNVHNLEVAGDNSYIANNVIVHNCITAKEAQLSATPMLTSNEGALQTTVGEYGIRVEGHPYNREARQKFVDEAVKLFKDKDYWLKWSMKSYEGSKGIGWQDRWNDYWGKWV